jgi:hypothetical protein
MKHEVRSILDGVESAVNRFDRGWPEPHTGAGNREPVDETVAPEILWRRPYLRSSS